MGDNDDQEVNITDDFIREQVMNSNGTYLKFYNETNNNWANVQNVLKVLNSDLFDPNKITTVFHIKIK